MAREIAPAGAQHAAQIDPAMVVEPPVFDRDDRLDEVGRKVVGSELVAPINAASGKWLASGGGKDNGSRRLFCDRVRQRQGIGAVAEEYRDDQDPKPPDQRQPEHRPPEGLEDRHLAPFFRPTPVPGPRTNCDKSRDRPRLIERNSAALCSRLLFDLRRSAEQVLVRARYFN